MQILGLLGMYFDAVVVEFKTFLLLFILALAILCFLYEQGVGKNLAEERELKSLMDIAFKFY